MNDILNFKEYVSNFDMQNRRVLLKYNHSLAVMELCRNLAIKLNLSKDDVHLATMIGLLHDIGRFNQLKIYDSFVDRQNIDHADEGVRILFEEDQIKNFNVSKDDYDVIKIAIRNHNKYAIEDNLNAREILFSKIIRDCDKIEILYRVSIKEIEFIDNGTGISLEVEKDFFNEIPIIHTKVKRNDEKMITMLAFIYDINFKESFVYLKENKILEKIFILINDKNLYEKYFNKAYEYIDKKIGG